MKKILSVLLAVCLLAGCWPFGALAAEGEFVIEDGILTQYNGPGGDVVIPAGVTAIGENVFLRRKDITSIAIPSGVTSIGYGAFNMCNNLSRVALPDSLREIGSWSFKECSFTSIAIPDSVTSIGDLAFSYCPNLTAVTIPSSVSHIGDSDSDGHAFKGCISLMNIHVDEGNPVYSSVDGVLYTKAQDKLLEYPCGRKGYFTMPYGAVAIGEGAFMSCEGLTGITISSSVTSIEYSAFSYCGSLTDVVMPDGVVSIDWGAFHGCRSLANVTIPNSVTRACSHKAGAQVFSADFAGFCVKFFCHTPVCLQKFALNPAKSSRKSPHSACENRL